MKIGIALATLAIALAVILMFWSTAGRDGAANAATADVDLDSLTSRIEALEKKNAELQARIEAGKLETPGSTRAPVENSATEGLTARVTEVERQLAELRSKVEVQAQLKANPQPGLVKPEAPPATLDEATRRARDPSATEAQRLAALHELRMLKLPDGTDARLAVLDDMIRLAQSSTDGDARADVWRQLNHITDARLKQPLLDALAFDTDKKAREKAADTLTDFLPDKVVEAALRQALQNDPSPDVKKQAAKSLGGH
jgi:cell division protein FtsB